MKVINSLNVLVDLIQRTHLSNSENKTIVLIGGVSRSGKSTLAKRLSIFFKTKMIECQIIELDSWLVSADQRKRNSKVIDRYHTKKIVNSMKDLMDGNVIFPPQYDSISRAQIAEIGSKSVSFKYGVLIIEGIIALALKELREIARLKIHTDISDFRRIKRLINFYKDVKALPNFEYKKLIKERELEEIPYIKKASDNADVIFASN